MEKANEVATGGTPEQTEQQLVEAGEENQNADAGGVISADNDEYVDVGDEEDIDEDTVMERTGTTSSARFNILATMVGGGSLSLPLAFHKSGNVLMGPILLLVTAVVTEFCFILLIRSARTLHPVTGRTKTPGTDSFESISAAAFGPMMLIFGKALVVLMCFFGTVGYAVLLRDMLEPITVLMYHNSEPTRWEGNSVMMTVVFLVTPLCTLKTLTALKRFGAASMFSVLILGSCVLVRSVQCNLADHEESWTSAFRLFPEKWKDILDVIPLYISCYVCHYNIPTVHNELRKPTEKRVSWWLRSTTWSASIFYLVLGFSGSAYSKCSANHEISGNILLDFDDSDPLLLLGRNCLAITITLAFPMLTIPARDIVIRSMMEWRSATATAVTQAHLELSEDPQESLSEPLLAREPQDAEEANVEGVSQAGASQESAPLDVPFGKRLGIAVILFWTATLVACCVASIDIVWDLLGSSLSIILSFLIPCGSYLVIIKQQSTAMETPGQNMSVIMAWLILAVTGPLMFVSTGNAVYDTFFQK